MTTTADSATVMLRKMGRASRFNRWMADTISPFLGQSVLEIGAGTGNLSALLCSGRTRYVATDSEAEHLSELKAHLQGRVQCLMWDIESEPPDYALRRAFDTVVCLNVLEHIANDAAALSHMFECLCPGGRLILLVPQGQEIFGTFDELLEHKRRYSRAELAAKIARAGFAPERILSFNRVTYPGWFLNARLLRRQTLSTAQLSVFEALVPLWRAVDPFLPWPPASLIAIAQRAG